MVCCAKKPVAVRSLVNQPWYHGIMTRQEARELLVNCGQWLVCFSTGNEKEISLHLKDYAFRTVRFVIEKIMQDGKICYQFRKFRPHHADYPCFSSIPSLIEYYHSVRLPTVNMKLKQKHCVKCPSYRIQPFELDIIKKKELGKGNFATVFMATYIEKEQKWWQKGYFKKTKTVAVKEVNSLIPDKIKQQIAVISLLREAKNFHGVEHDHIVKFIGIVCFQHPIKLVMEYCAGGSLLDHILIHTNISICERVLYLCESSIGIRYLHANEIVHRDLAARNILISANGLIKIADFGLSKFTQDYMPDNLVTTNMPHRIAAPEIILHWEKTQSTISLTEDMEPKDDMYSQKSDVWAFGALIYEVFNNGHPIFDQISMTEIRTNIKAVNMPELPSATPELLVQMVKEHMWQNEKKNRTNFNEIVKSLYNYLLQTEVGMMPAPENMALNQIKGVKRTFGFRKNSQYLLYCQNIET